MECIFLKTPEKEILWADIPNRHSMLVTEQVFLGHFFKEATGLAWPALTGEYHSESDAHTLDFTLGQPGATGLLGGDSDSCRHAVPPRQRQRHQTGQATMTPSQQGNTLSHTKLVFC